MYLICNHNLKHNSKFLDKWCLEIEYSRISNQIMILIYIDFQYWLSCDILHLVYEYSIKKCFYGNVIRYYELC